MALEADYKTLRKKNRDGFEQAIMGAVASSLGTDATQNVHVMFHDLQDSTAMFFLRAGGGTRRLSVKCGGGGGLHSGSLVELACV